MPSLEAEIVVRPAGHKTKGFHAICSSAAGDREYLAGHETSFLEMSRPDVVGSCVGPY